jgi:hypothetical protein
MDHPEAALTTGEALSRRRWLAKLGALAGLSAVGSFAYGRLGRAAGLPTLVLPAGLSPLLVARLRGFHSRYDAVFVAQGAGPMGAMIASDVLRFRGQDLWLDALQQWIERGGWTQAADLSLNVAEVAGTDVRRYAAGILADSPTPGLSAAAHGSRIIALHRTETDATAKTYWARLRRRLGI